MIQVAENNQRLQEYLFSYLSKEEKQVDYKEIEDWKNTLFEDDDTKLFEVSQNNVLVGVFHCTIWTDIIHLNFVYCNQDKVNLVYSEICSYLKENYKGVTLEYYFYQHEEQIEDFFKRIDSSIKCLSHMMEYNPYYPKAVVKEDSYSIVPFEEKYAGILKKLKSNQINFENTVIYVALKKHKPIGFIVLSPEEDNTIYIEELNVLPRYKDGIKSLLIISILKNYSGYDIAVIVSYYNEEEIKFYESMGFEINPKRTLMEASILL